MGPGQSPLPEPQPEQPGALVEPEDQLRLGHQHLQRCARGRDGGVGGRGREDERPATLEEQPADRLRPADCRAGRAQGLGEGDHPDHVVAGHPQVGGEPAPSRTGRSQSVGLVDDQPGAAALGQPVEGD